MRNAVPKCYLAAASLLLLLAGSNPRATASVNPPPPSLQLAYRFLVKGLPLAGPRHQLELVPEPSDGWWHQPLFVVRQRGEGTLAGTEWRGLNEPFDLSVAIELSVAEFSPLPVSSEELWRALQLKSHRERLEGRFRIERGDVWSTLHFESRQGSFRTSTLDPDRFRIREGETYQVTVRFHVATEPEIELIEQGPVVVFDAAICELHGERMTLFPVPVTWGSPTDWNYHPSLGRALREGERARFPNYIERLNGGCVTYPGASNTADIHICPACAAAFQSLSE